MNQSTPKSPRRILILDDQSEMVDACAAALQRDYSVIKTSLPMEALSVAQMGRSSIDLILSDYHMPQMNGVAFLTEMRRLGLEIPVILYTGKVIDPAEREGLGRFLKILQKPFSMHDLRSEVASALADIDQDESTEALGNVARYLEEFLRVKGLEDFASADSATARRVLGAGPEFEVFLAWATLRDLRREARTSSSPGAVLGVGKTK